MQRTARSLLRLRPTAMSSSITAPGLPTARQIQSAARAGTVLDPEDISNIAQREQEITGGQPAPGGPTATAQSVYTKQKNFMDKAQEVVSKPPGQITTEDASELMSKEARALGGQRPLKGSLSAEAQSIAQRNEQGGGVGGGVSREAFVTKDDAAMAQSVESEIHGGETPKGSTAAQM